MSDGYLFDITDVETERNLLLQKEAADRAIVDTIEFPDTQMLGAKLVEWANNGFVDGFSIFQLRWIRLQFAQTVCIVSSSSTLRISPELLSETRWND